MTLIALLRELPSLWLAVATAAVATAAATAAAATATATTTAAATATATAAAATAAATAAAATAAAATAAAALALAFYVFPSFTLALLSPRFRHFVEVFRFPFRVPVGDATMLTNRLVR